MVWARAERKRDSGNTAQSMLKMAGRKFMNVVMEDMQRVLSLQRQCLLLLMRLLSLCCLHQLRGNSHAGAGGRCRGRGQRSPENKQGDTFLEKMNRFFFFVHVVA